MDRFEWLRCQPWLLPWHACHHLASSFPCPPCAAGTPSLCPHLNWVFHGFASFHAFAANQQQQDVDHDMGPLSQDAAHLFFSVQPPLRDPSQLALKVGVARKNSGRSASVVVLTFDESSLYFLDFQQVLTISTWKPEQGCKLCRKPNFMSRDDDRENTCACQLLPGYLSLRLKHVALNIYSIVQSKDCLGAPSHNPSQSIGVLDQLYATLEEGRLHSIYGLRKEDCALPSSQATPEPNSLVNDSNVMLQQFLTRLDCMSESAVRAVEVCSADVPWMCRLLHTVAQHAADRKANSTHLKTLQHQLQSCLQALEEEEQAHITTIWGGSSIQQEEVRTLGAAALQQTMEQRKQLEEAVLWLELMNAA